MYFEATPEQIKKARWPHEVFLINLILNHVLFFIAFLGMAGSYPFLLLLVPIISLVSMIYLLLGAKKSLKKDDWYVYCHWQICARRSKFFIIMLLILATIMLVIIFGFASGELKNLRPGHYALGGITILPTMLSVLALILMESDSMHKAKIGFVPEWLIKKYPNNQPPLQQN